MYQFLSQKVTVKVVQCNGQMPIDRQMAAYYVGTGLTCLYTCLYIICADEDRCDSPIDVSQSQPITHIASRFASIVCLLSLLLELLN